jgi:Xaa-Pro dipeptidase
MDGGSKARPAPPTFVRTPLPERLCNVGRLLDTLEQRGMDGIVAYLRPHVFYLSGFAPPSNASIQETNGYAAVVISRHEPTHPVLVVAEFDLAHVLRQPSWVRDVRPYATLLSPLDISWGAPLDHFVPAPLLATERGQAARDHYAPSLVEGVARAMRDLGLAGGTVGFDDLRFAAAVAPGDVRVADAYGALKYTRQVKTPAEVSLLREATRLNQLAIERTLASWSRGMTWQELTRSYHAIAVGLGGFVRDPGAIVMANPPGAEVPYHTQSGLEDFVVEPGMHIMWDCHGTWARYCWDGGKTWVVDDEPHAAARRIAGATATAMVELQDAMRPGARISELQARARRAYRQAGLVDADRAYIFFHGLGLEHIDMELLASRQDWSLEEGMVVSAHLHVPGDDRHRSWLEEIYLVTRTGGDPFFTWGYEPIAGRGTEHGGAEQTGISATA